jgi:hypothetical protein
MVYEYTFQNGITFIIKPLKPKKEIYLFISIVHIYTIYDLSVSLWKHKTLTF